MQPHPAVTEQNLLLPHCQLHAAPPCVCVKLAQQPDSQSLLDITANSPASLTGALLLT